MQNLYIVSLKIERRNLSTNIYINRRLYSLLLKIYLCKRAIPQSFITCFGKIIQLHKVKQTSPNKIMLLSFLFLGKQNWKKKKNSAILWICSWSRNIFECKLYPIRTCRNSWYGKMHVYTIIATFLSFDEKTEFRARIQTILVFCGGKLNILKY